MEKKKYNGLTLFKNENGGRPMYRNNEPILNNNGDMVLIPLFNGILNIEEPLPVGQYEVKLREKVSNNTGTIYLWGGIKPKEENKFSQKQHYQDKANGYQKETRPIGLVKQQEKDLEPLTDDEIPF